MLAGIPAAPDNVIPSYKGSVVVDNIVNKLEFMGAVALKLVVVEFIIVIGTFFNSEVVLLLKNNILFGILYTFLIFVFNGIPSPDIYLPATILYVPIIGEVTVCDTETVHAFPDPDTIVVPIAIPDPDISIPVISDGPPIVVKLVSIIETIENVCCGIDTKLENNVPLFDKVILDDVDDDVVVFDTMFAEVTLFNVNVLAILSIVVIIVLLCIMPVTGEYILEYFGISVMSVMLVSNPETDNKLVPDGAYPVIVNCGFIIILNDDIIFAVTGLLNFSCIVLFGLVVTSNTFVSD